MNQNTTKRQVLLSTFIGLSAYWFANSVLWIPWKFNEALGITFMILMVPFLWGACSNFCLNRIPSTEWHKKKFLVAIVFLIIGIASDYFFFAIWRHIPTELYKPTTFASYGLLFFMPVIIGSLKKKKTECKPITTKTLILSLITGCVFLATTLYAVQFW